MRDGTGEPAERVGADETAELAELAELDAPDEPDEPAEPAEPVAPVAPVAPAALEGPDDAGDDQIVVDRCCQEPG